MVMCWDITKGRPVDPSCTGDEDYLLFCVGATERPRKKTPAVIGPASVYYVSETFRQLVEQMERGCHQFFPYALRNGKNDPPADKPYYTLNITNRAASIILSEKHREQVYRSPSKYVPKWRTVRSSIFGRQDDMYMLRRDRISGFHLWWEATVGNGFFVSADFLARFDALKLKKLERVYCLET